jgi:hypothetical protein
MLIFRKLLMWGRYFSPLNLSCMHVTLRLFLEDICFAVSTPTIEGNVAEIVVELFFGLSLLKAEVALTREIWLKPTDGSLTVY